MSAPHYAPHWSDSPPVVIDDTEKNEAVNRIERDLKAWAAAQPTETPNPSPMESQCQPRE